MNKSPIWFTAALLVLLQTKTASSGPPFTAVAFAPSGTEVLLGSQAGIEIRSWPKLALTRQLATELVHVHDIAFSPDGKHMIAAGGAPAEWGAVELVSWPNTNLMQRISTHEDLVMRVAWSPDSTRWLTASADGTCQCFLAAGQKPLAVFSGHSRGVSAAGFLPDGQTVVTAGIDQTLQVWNSQSGELLRTLSNHAAGINDVAVKPIDGRTASDGESEAGAQPAAQPRAQPPLPVVASASDDRTVRLWQPTIGRLLRFVKLTSIPRTIAWTHAGACIAVGCDDGTLRVFDGESLELLETTQVLDGPVYAIALRPSDDGSSDEFLVAGAGEPRVHRRPRR